VCRPRVSTRPTLRRPSREGAPRSTRAARGFTFPELCLGLVILALVMGAVAAFTLAMSQSWTHAQETEQVSITARQVTARLTRVVQDAKLIGAVTNGAVNANPLIPAAVILWVEDTNGDGQIQGAECAMFEHDTGTRLLKYYPSGQGDASAPLSWAVFTSQAVLTNFKVGRQWQPVARGAHAIRFVAHATGSAQQRPMLEFTIKLKPVSADASDDRNIATEYGTCVVRAPAKQPA
jgi:type II secretory pathway component PulJ